MTNQRKIICLACKGRGFLDTHIAQLYCNWCKGTGSRVELIYEFELSELKALYKLFEHQYIPYEQTEVHSVINKIQKYLKDKHGYI